MWNLLRAARRDDPNFAMNIQELLEAAQRNIIFCMGGLFLAWLFWLSATDPATVILDTGPYMAVLVLVGGLTLLIVQRGYLLAAQVAWQIGLTGLIVLALRVFQIPEIIFCFIFLPMIASVTVGWWFAALSESLVIGAVYLLATTAGFPPVSQAFQVTTIVGGLTAGLLGWAAVHALLTLSDWALTSFRQARTNVEDARRQREDLFQVQEDLLQANRELARLTNRLKVLTQEAEEARRVKEQFVANVSHELRTPLNMVIGFCEVIADSPRVYGNLPPALLADIAAIKRNGQHLASLVNDVLDLSQIEAGRMALTKDWTTIQEIIQAAVEAVRTLFDSKGLYLETSIQPEPIPLLCDSTRIREVLLNLLSNAGRITDKGGVQVEVRCGAGALTVSVADTGPGISAENQKKLFEPFQQLDNSIRRKGGTGLGLSISRRFVEMHGGKMWVESTLGRGTTFFFELPLDTPIEPGSEAVSSARRWINPYTQFDRRIRRSKAPLQALIPRYVLLEAGDALQRLFSRYMEGAELVQSRDLESAIAELAHSPSQALIVNMLSFRDQPDLLAQAGDLPYGASLVECWVPGEEASQMDGVLRYMTKPVKRDDLLASIEQVNGSAVRSVLIVDDQPEILQLFARVLASADREYTVLRARNGRLALDLMRSRRPDVVLLDLVMPDFDGFEVLREKNADESIRDIPVIVVSANDISGAPIVSNHMAVRRRSGFSAREFLACIEAVSEILSPKAPPDDRALPAEPGV